MSYVIGEKPPVKLGDEQGGSWIRPIVHYIGQRPIERVTFRWNNSLCIDDYVINGFFMSHDNLARKTHYLMGQYHLDNSSENGHSERQVEVEFHEENLSMVVNGEERYVKQALGIFGKALRKTKTPNDGVLLPYEWYENGMANVLKELEGSDIKRYKVDELKFKFEEVLPDPREYKRPQPLSPPSKESHRIMAA